MHTAVHVSRAAAHLNRRLNDGVGPYLLVSSAPVWTHHRSLSSDTCASKGTGTFPIFDPKTDLPETLSAVCRAPSCLLMLLGNHKLWMADTSTKANLTPPLRCCHVPEKAEVTPPPPPMLISTRTFSRATLAVQRSLSRARWPPQEGSGDPALVTPSISWRAITVDPPPHRLPTGSP